MNRVQPLTIKNVAATAACSPAAAVAQYTPGHPRDPYAFFSPLHYEPNYAYPLLIWLHGPLDDESQLRRIMPLVSMRNYVAVGPQATRAVRGSDTAATTYTWRQTESDIALAEQRVLEAIERARRRFHIRQERIFLAGNDCGGTMAFRVALRQPRLFAGVLSVLGPFPVGRAPLCRIDEARRMPLFLACGRDSAVYPPEHVSADLRLFHAAGLSVSLRQYPCGHEVTSQMLADLDRWIMEQIAAPR